MALPISGSDFGVKKRDNVNQEQQGASLSGDSFWPLAAPIFTAGARGGAAKLVAIQGRAREMNGRRHHELHRSPYG